MNKGIDYLLSRWPMYQDRFLLDVIRELFLSDHITEAKALTELISCNNSFKYRLGRYKHILENWEGKFRYGSMVMRSWNFDGQPEDYIPVKVWTFRTCPEPPFELDSGQKIISADKDGVFSDNAFRYTWVELAEYTINGEPCHD